MDLYTDGLWCIDRVKATLERTMNTAKALRIYSLFVVLWAMFVQGAEPSGAVETGKVDPSIYGVQTHFAQSKGAPAIHLPLIREANISSIRDEVYWSQVETQKGVYVIPEHIIKALDLAISNGIKPLIILDYGNKYYDGGGMPISEEAQAAFVRYVAFVASYFKGKVHHYEVWNEWNIGAGNIIPKPPFKGDPADYVRLLAKTTAALKRIDPSVVVLGGAVAGWDGSWVEDILKNGAIRHLDGLSIHPYSYNSGWEGRPEKLINWLDKLEEITKKYSNGREIPLYLTEIGWPNHTADIGTQPEVAANYLSRLFLLAAARPFIRGIWWYDFQDDGTELHNAEHNFGLITIDGSPKPAWFMMRDLLAVVQNARFIAQVPAESGLFALRFSNRDGSSTLAIWTDWKDKLARVAIRCAAGASEKMTLQQLGRGDPYFATPLNSGDKTFKLTADGTPWLLHGTFNTVNIDVKWVEIPSNGSFFLRR